MREVLIVGAGKIGSVIADFLSASGDYRGDRGRPRRRAARTRGARTAAGPGTRARRHKRRCAARQRSKAASRINACPFRHERDPRPRRWTRPRIILTSPRMCRARLIRSLAADARDRTDPPVRARPGFISIAAYHLATGF